MRKSLLVIFGFLIGLTGYACVLASHHLNFGLSNLHEETVQIQSFFDQAIARLLCLSFFVLMVLDITAERVNLVSTLKYAALLSSALLINIIQPTNQYLDQQMSDAGYHFCREDDAATVFSIQRTIRTYSQEQCPPDE
jgi:hypothetical protein